MDRQSGGRLKPVDPIDAAKANDLFEHFLTATTLKTIQGSYRLLCDILHLKPNLFPLFYPKLRASLTSWKAKALWKKFDARASHKCYGRGKICSNTRVLVIGGGPCGLRTAIEAQLLGAKVVVIEKRDRITRNNVLHLWPFVIEDLRALGAKKFFGKFCAGAIDHISIRQLQVIMLKVALLLGIEVHTEVSFKQILEPSAKDKIGWRAEFIPADHPVSQYEFDVCIGADGKRNTLRGFTRKEFRGKLAIAITANFINKRTEAEARVEEISGVAFIFNQKFFKELYAETGIDLENIVYYKDDTHYFVMTAKKHSLIDKGVIVQDLPDTAKLLAPENVDRDALMAYAKQAANFSTLNQMPDMEFAVNHYGQPDVAMFDFTSMYAAENASKIFERHGHKLLMMLVGDSLLEPFWPTGSGCARGFLSSLDACWAIRNWGSGSMTPLEVISERESIYRLLGQTTPENLQRDTKSYTLDPSTRYPNLNRNIVVPLQVINLFDTDDPLSIEKTPRALPIVNATELPKKRRRQSAADPNTLLPWLREQIREYEDLTLNDLTTSFKDGRVLCAILHHYRPDLLDYSTIKPEDASKNNQLAFDLLDREIGILPVMTGQEMAQSSIPDYLTMVSYLSQIYDTFRGEIPHIKHPKLDLPEFKKSEYKMPKLTPSAFAVHAHATVIPPPAYAPPARVSGRHKRHVERLNLIDTQHQAPDRKSRKRKTIDKQQLALSMEEKERRWVEIIANRNDRQSKRKHHRKMQTEQFIKSMQMLQANGKPDASGPFEDYSIYLYRQNAPNFEDRVRNLEKQFIYFPEKDSRLPTLSKGAGDEDFTERIKDFEDKLRETVPQEKRPKDLLRAIGKIETTDWNIKEIEKKINENKMGKNTNKEKERVPKWSREQFLARQTKMEKQHLERQDSTGGKFADLDKNIKDLDMKLKEGTAREQGPRGANKVATITEKLTKTTTVPPEAESPKPVQKSNSRSAVVLPSQGGSEFCHFCSKRVYLMERLSAEGRFFHRGCFKCQYCGIALRLGSYLFDREGQYGHKFYCTQHFGMQGTISSHIKGNKIVRKTSTRLSREQNSPEKKLLSSVAGVDLLDRVQTPERVEFANLSTGFVSSDHEESQMDEDEWTDRNFGASTAEIGSSDDDSSESSDDDSDDEEVFEEAMDEPPTKEGTLRWAERMKKKYDQIDYDSNSDPSSYYENSSSDDDSETATEGEEEIRARELRKQEVDVKEPVIGSDTETEVASDESSTESSSVEQNSATEISTDSEFAQDDPTPTREIPSIVLNDCNVTKTRGSYQTPKKVQVKSSVLQKPMNGQQKTGDIELKFTPLVTSTISHKTPDIANVKPSLNLLNAKNDGYSLNRTQSTGGIATKVSLELKKKYLLGGDQFGSSIQKSGSASTLDSKLKSFTSNISAQQKRLQPASEISPTMQAFFQSTSANKISPLLSSKNVLNENQVNDDKTTKAGLELDEKNPKVIDDFIQPDLTKNIGIIENVVAAAVAVEEKQDLPKVTEESPPAVEFANETEGRPRSPVHETSIEVPTIDWNKDKVMKKSETDFSDSLSSGSSSDEEESDPMKTGVKSPNVKTFSEIPRVEIHDSSGEILPEDDMALDSLCVVSDVKTKDEDSESLPPKSISSEKKSLNQPKQLPVLEKLITPEPELNAEPFKLEFASGRSSPVSISESMGVEATTALTETELSDWARDGTVSDDFEDEDFGMNPDYSTVRRNKKPKDVGALSCGDQHQAEVRIASIEDFDDMGHVCGRDKQIKEATNKICVSENAARLADFDSIEYMDTGTEDSSDDNVINNTGYVQFVDDDEIAQDSLIPHITEINEAINPTVTTNNGYCIFENEPEDNFGGKVIDLKPTDLEELKQKQNLYEHEEDSLLILDAGTTTEETTTSDTTVKNVFEEMPDEKSNVITDDIKYQEHCQRLQSRNVEFGNVRDSIDIRKSRRKSKSESPPAKQPDLIQEEKEPVKIVEPIAVKPPLNRKEEIEKQRDQEKRLVHEMVLNKILAEKKLSDKKKRTRNSFSPISSPSGPFDLVKSATTDITLPSIDEITPKRYSTISSGSSSIYVTPDVLLSANSSPIIDTIPLQKSQTVAGIPDNFNRPNRLHLSERHNDDFYTPMTSMKQPISVQASFLAKQKIPTTTSTPLANPEGFSLPDIRKALFKDDFKTPIPPPRMKYDDMNRTAERLKQDARARAKLKSDEDLGLSPEDLRLLKLRQKMQKSKGKENENIVLYNDTLGRHKRSLFRRSMSGEDDVVAVKVALPENDNAINDYRARTKSVSDINAKSFSSAKSLDADLVVIPDDFPKEQKQQFFKSDPNLLTEVDNKRDKKKSKDRERRKSITKFLSEFFLKKKDSSPKTPNTGGSSKSFLSRISPKAKEKSKDKIIEENPRRKSFSGPSIRQNDQSPPPIPPPPLNYPSGRHSKGTDSGSDVECDWRRVDRSSCDTLDQSGTLDGSTNSLGGRKSRSAKKAARQAQLKRHRMAQEIQRKLEETEVKTRELEQRGVEVEKALRGEVNGSTSQDCAKEESELLREWFDLMRDRTELRRYERELMVRAQELQLEDRHARLQQDLRERLAGNDESKTREDISTEGAILNEMLEIVAKRDSLIVLLEEDRQRYNEEDKDLEEQVLAKGLRLTPLKKTPE